MSSAAIIELLQQCCGEELDVIFHTDYSGRGMYGSRCVGISGSHSDCTKVIGSVLKSLTASAVAAALSNQDIDELADAEALLEEAVDVLLDYSQDSLGYDCILYWPALEM